MIRLSFPSEGRGPVLVFGARKSMSGLDFGDSVVAAIVLPT